MEKTGKPPYLCNKQNTKAMIEEITNAVDSLGIAGPEEIIEVPHTPLTELFTMGGTGGMIIISILLICLLLAAWKAPRWVKEIGIGALVVSIFWSLSGMFNACDMIQMFGDASPTIVAGGLKACLISTLYGLIVYFISLIIRIIQKPRI